MIESTKLGFEAALSSAKQGKLIQREAWNGKGMFVYMRPEFHCNTTELQKMDSVPSEVIKYLKRKPDYIPVKLSSYLCLKDANGNIMNGWQPNTYDLLAEDWQVVSY